MRRLTLLALTVVALLALAPAAEARSLWASAHQDLLRPRARQHTSCAIARRAMRVFVLSRRTFAWVRSPVTHKRYRFRLWREEGGLGSGYYLEARARGDHGSTLSAAFRVRI
jgi:hypothetical protein